MIEFTSFKSIFDNKTHRRYSYQDWDDFGRVLMKMSVIPGYKPKRGERIPKHASPLISPAIFEKGTTRANQNVRYWSKWAGMDIDNYDGLMEDALQVFSPYSFYCYSTASSTKKNPKFRVVLNLTHEIKADRIKHFWYAINKEFNSIADPQTKDLSRMYYVPAKYPDAFNFIFSNRGKPVDPDVFMLRHDYVEEKKDMLSYMPEHIQKAVIQEKHDSLTNVDVTWTSYLDCPFVNKKMLKGYQDHAYVDGTGRYAFFYSFMVNIASNAIRAKYPITPGEIASLARQVDAANGNRFKHRPMELEAERALEFIIRTSPF